MKRVPIFMISDENYAAYMGTCIFSIISQTSSYIDFYILDGGICADSKRKIQKVLDEFTNASIKYHSISHDSFNGFPIIAHFSINTYFRYLIPVLEPGLGKVLYVDSDIVINGDITSLFDEDLGGFPLGAVPYLYENRPQPYDYCASSKQRFGLSPQHPYFNAGVMVIDNSYWVANKISEKLFITTSKYNDLLVYPDQDVLNIVFERNYQVLPPRFNVVVDMFTDLKRPIPDDTIIFHFTGGRRERPTHSLRAPASDIFWKFANMTPFKDDLRWEVVKNYLLLIDQPQSIKKGIRYYRYKIYSKIFWGKWKERYREKYIKLRRKVRRF